MCTVRALAAAGVLVPMCLAGAAESASFPPPPPLQPGTALIYLYGGNGGGLLIGMPFFIDGIKVAVTHPGGCTEMVVPAGSHEFSSGAPLSGSLLTKLVHPAVGGRVTWESGKAYLISYGDKLTNAATAVEIAVRQQTASPVVAPAIGCRYGKPMNLEKLTPTASGAPTSPSK